MRIIRLVICDVVNIAAVTIVILSLCIYFVLGNIADWLEPEQETHEHDY